MIIKCTEPRAPEYSLTRDYSEYGSYLESITSFATMKNKVDKLLANESKHTIVVYPNYFIIDGFTYNISPTLCKLKTL